MSENSKPYDLERRTTQFSKDIINLCSKIPQDTINKPLVSQLIRSRTSIGANYSEANGASSKDELRVLWKESKELTLIFSTIAKNSKN